MTPVRFYRFGFQEVIFIRLAAWSAGVQVPFAVGSRRCAPHPEPDASVTSVRSGVDFCRGTPPDRLSVFTHQSNDWSTVGGIVTDFFIILAKISICFIGL